MAAYTFKTENKQSYWLLITYTKINNTLLEKHYFVDIAEVNRTETLTLVVLIVSVVSFYNCHVVKISMIF